jgi:hypothetical protein
VGEGAGVDSLVLEGGAVVVSGKSEAGGGKEISVSGAGSGACSFDDGGAVFSPDDCGLFLFLFAAAAVTEGA